MSSDSTTRFGAPIREKIFTYIVFAIAIIYTSRLGYLQIIRGSEYLDRSETQAIKEKTKIPYRGVMYDRFGRQIIKNQGSFCVTITPFDFRLECIPLLSDITGLSADTIKQIYIDNKKMRFNEVKILRDVSPQIVAMIEESRNLLPGVDLSIETKRIYNFLGNGSHLFGYRTEINTDQLKNMGDFYRPGDLIGQTGIEKSYENPYLRGKKGASFIAVNASGQPIESFNKGKSDIDAIEGDDLYLGIDTKLQSIAEVGLSGRSGGVVVIDPRNGEVMALASKPDYDLRELSSANASMTYRKLQQNEEKPLFNRAMQSMYPPGSTWKMLMSLVAMEEGILTPKSTIPCGGAYTYGGRSFKCHGAHGNTTIETSIRASCNVFYYKLGQMLGIDKYNYWSSLFRFGQLTGIDVSGEKSGLLASREYYKRYGVTGKMIDGRMINLGIGQGEIGVTPLQMACYCATLANKGTYYTPHVVRKTFNKQFQRFEPIAFDSLELPIKKEYFEPIHKGMFGACNLAGGTATKVMAGIKGGVKAAGKTGTAQNPHGKDHSWFICFAPHDKPTIAMCVMVENAGFGAEVAAPIAKKILDAYFDPNRDSTENDSTLHIKDSNAIAQTLSPQIYRAISYERIQHELANIPFSIPQIAPQIVNCSDATAVYISETEQAFSAYSYSLKYSESLYSVNNDPHNLSTSSDTILAQMHISNSLNTICYNECTSQSEIVTEMISSTTPSFPLLCS